MKTCCDTSFETLTSYLRPDCRYLICLVFIYLPVEKTRRWNFRSIDRERALSTVVCIFGYEYIYLVPLMTFFLHQWHLTTWVDLIQVYVWSNNNNFYLVTKYNFFSSQQTRVISWVDRVMYHWLDIIWIQSSIYYFDW